MATLEITHDTEYLARADGHIERGTITISTDSNGNGTETCNFRDSFNSNTAYQVVLFPLSADGLDVFGVTKNASSVDVSVTGSSTTSGTIDVDVIVAGSKHIE